MRRVIDRCYYHYYDHWNYYHGMEVYVQVFDWEGSTEKKTGQAEEVVSWSVYEKST